jgi:hypothetical protein
MLPIAMSADIGATEVGDGCKSALSFGRAGGIRRVLHPFRGQPTPDE